MGMTANYCYWRVWDVQPEEPGVVPWGLQRY